MAGSFKHCNDDNNEFRFDLIENMGDAYEACEHMHFMIHWLVSHNKSLIESASNAYYKKMRGE